MRLEEAIQTAVTRLQRQGIEGWGLQPSSPELLELGELIQVAPVEGCLDDLCGHVFHDPAAPTLRWVPKSGTLQHLGNDGRHDYYALRLPERDLFLRFRPAKACYGEWFYRAELDVVDPAEVPEYLLASQVNKE